MTETSPIPTLLAFLVCDTVIRDGATKKHTLVGIFDRIAAPKVPFPINSLGLYAKMVEGSGSYEVKVRFVNLKDESPVMEITADMQWNIPDEPMELGMNFTGIPISEFGIYEIQLYANKIFLGRALLRALELKLPASGPSRGN